MLLVKFIFNYVVRFIFFDKLITLKIWVQGGSEGP